MEDKIVSSFFGGIGDNLQITSTVKRFSELGHKVYLSDKCAFRNPEIKELVWGLNPHIVGESSLPANIGDGAGITINHNNSDSFMANWEIAHGLPPPYNKYPDIYYVPKRNKSVEDKILVDVTCTSGQKYYQQEPIRRYLAENLNRNDVLIALFNDGIAIPMLLADGYACEFIDNIFDYCDKIFSCKKFVSLHAGGMVLASALQKYGEIDCDCLVTNHPIHTIGALNHHHFYDNINYITI